MAPDPTTGLLKTSFTLYFGMGDTPISGDGFRGDEAISKGPVGIVKIQDPIETLPVSDYIIFNEFHWLVSSSGI